MSELIEKDAIREVMAEYCFRLDNDRFADMAALFTEDGTGTPRSARAPDERKLRHWCAACASRRTPGRGQSITSPML